MRKLFHEIDQLLRGGFTQKADLAEGRIQVSVRVLVLAGVLLGVIYGLFMGLYAPFRPGNPSWEQMLATAVKVPMLFLLTLVVSFPSLYVFSAMSQSRLRFAQTLRLLLIAITVNLALLASFGPITVFFTFSTESYPFMVLLNVAFFGISGFVGLGFLRKALDAVFETPPAPAAQAKEETSESGEAQESPQPTVLRRGVRNERPKTIFMVWTVIYGVVGAQMGWILRPFIGDPALPFQLFRDRESNFFDAVLRTLGRLFS